MQRTGATQQDRRPILHEKGSFWTTATPIRDLMAEATSPLEYRMPEEYLLAIKKKKKKKSEQSIPPTLLQYLRGSTDHQSCQGDEQSEI